MSGDLKNATVYIGFFGSAEKLRTGLTMLRNNRYRIQDLVAKSVILKYTPRLRFVVDESVTRGNRVLDIIAELERETPLT
jgi:ribosome-binding factor A